MLMRKRRAKGQLLTGKLRWESKAGLKIPFSGTPFILEGQRVMECSFGKRKQQKRKHEEVSLFLN